MSYNPLKKEDPMSEMLSNMVDFNQIKKRLIASMKEDNTNNFIIWMSKAKDVNKRHLLILIRNKTLNFTIEQEKIVNSMFPNIESRRDINEFTI